MARSWFTTYPDKYFMANLKKGGRREIFWTFIILGAAHQLLFKNIINIASQNQVDRQTQWHRSRSFTGGIFKAH